MDDLDASTLEELLSAVGEHLAAARATAAIVVVGGGALSIMGWVDRTTNDIDVIARARRDAGRWVVGPPEPLPAVLVDAVARVARDYALFAAVDQGSESVHFQDLLAIDPLDSELDDAAEWVARQDPASGFAALVEEEVGNVRDALGRDR